MPSRSDPILNRRQVRQAAKLWRDEPGRGGFLESRRYDVVIDGRPYPPKAIASFANEIAGNGVLKPSDFGGAREGKWHNEFARLGFEIRQKGDALVDPEETIRRYRDDDRFVGCPRAFIVTGKPEHDAHNQALRKVNQSGYWFLRDGRVEPGDALFLILPSPSGAGGYPRQLFCGVLSEAPNRDIEEGKVLFQVERFYLLDAISADVKRFLGDRVPPQGDRVNTVWDDEDVREKLGAARGMSSDDDDEGYPEGAEKFKQHMSRERNRKVVELAKLRRFEATGKLECEACGFDFLKTYGERGKGFIEAHHRIPVASLAARSRVRIKDFALVCSNCHRMLHRMSPLMTAEDLKEHLDGTLDSDVSVLPGVYPRAGAC